MKNKIKFISIALVLVLALVCTFAFVGCISIEPLDEVEDDGKVSTSTGETNIPTDNVGNSYDVTTQVGTPSNTATSLTEIVAEIQTSVVIINTDVGAGSGVIYGKITGEDASMVVTCCHVIDGASKIEVTINDADIDSSNDVKLSATLIGMDDDSDLAVLKIKGSNYNYAELRNTDEAKIQLAEQAIAIGNPLGAGISVTVGHISGISKTINMDGVNMTLLQTDAAVNSGNSGGALFDAEGYLIGIVNAKSTGDTVEGMGYAIPVYDVIDICDSLIKTSGSAKYNGLGYIEGKIRLGVVVNTLDRETLANNFNNISNYLPGENEYYYYISPNYELNPYGSVAISDKNGKIKKGMLITGLTITDANGQAQKKVFTDDYELADFLESSKVGDTVTLHMLEQKVTVTGGILIGSYSYSYETFDVAITLQQYVYGYKG